MVDRTRLAEYLKDYDDGYGVYDDTTPTIEALAAAARAVVEAPEVWLCETHGAGQPKRDGGPFDDKCYEWWIGEFNPEDPPLTPCRMVRVFLVPAEETV
jgi:hypothetical protein